MARVSPMSPLLVLLLLSLGGCLDARPATVASGVEPMADSAGVSENNAAAPPYRGQPDTTPQAVAAIQDEKPVTFLGHVLLPDPMFAEYAACTGQLLFDDPAFLQQFGFNRSFAGWSYAFNVSGLAVHFHPDAPGADLAMGIVPTDAFAAFVCSPTRANVHFALVLAPPSHVAFFGRSIAPDPGAHVTGHCDADRGASMLGTTFALPPHVAGWAFSFNMPGFVADFHGPARTAGESGIVPRAAEQVRVCSHSQAYGEFRLLLTPP